MTLEHTAYKVRYIRLRTLCGYAALWLTKLQPLLDIISIYRYPGSEAVYDNSDPISGPWLSPNSVTVTLFPNEFFISKPPL